MSSIDSSRRGVLVAAGAALLASCASRPSEKPADEDKGDLLWPSPPELPRFQFETALRSPSDIEVETEQQRLQRTLTGLSTKDERVLDKPGAVAARGGRIYVADSVRRAIVVFDVPRRKVFQLGLRAPGTLAKPIAMAVDNKRQLFVADATLRKVMVYDALGLFQRSIGEPADLERPTGVAVSRDGERVFVIDRSDNDSDQHRVMAYRSDGTKLREIGKRGRNPGEFNVPVQGAVGPDDHLHVLDAGNFRVQTFDRDGNFVRSFGGVGSSLGQLARPRGLACDDEGLIYVSDTAFGNVQVFNPAGELLITLGRGDRRDLPGRYGLLTGVAVDETGRVYLVDQLFSKVEVIRRLSEDEGRKLQAAKASS